MRYNIFQFSHAAIFCNLSCWDCQRTTADCPNLIWLSARWSFCQMEPISTFAHQNSDKPQLAECGSADFDITQSSVMENRNNLLDITVHTFDCEKRHYLTSILDGSSPVVSLCISHSSYIKQAVSTASQNTLIKTSQAPNFLI